MALLCRLATGEAGRTVQIKLPLNAKKNFLVLMGGTCVLAGGTCILNGKVLQEWEEWETDCQVCLCNRGEFICEDKPNTKQENPCFKKSGSLCEERGCYDNRDEMDPFIPDEELQIVQLGTYRQGTKTCMCELGHKYIFCMDS